MWNVTLVTIEKPDDWNWLRSDSEVWISTWNSKAYEALPPRYFNFTDTVSVYRVVEKP